jgi:hypothetical protein
MFNFATMIDIAFRPNGFRTSNVSLGSNHVYPSYRNADGVRSARVAEDCDLPEGQSCPSCYGDPAWSCYPTSGACAGPDSCWCIAIDETQSVNCCDYECFAFIGGYEVYIYCGCGLDDGCTPE